MSSRSKKTNFSYDLAIFSLALFFLLLLSAGVKAEAYKVNTYDKAFGDELEAGNWNQLSLDFLFKNRNEGQSIAGWLGLGGAVLDSDFNLLAGGTIGADLFSGDMAAANVFSGEFGDSTGGGPYYFPDNVGINSLLGLGTYNFSASNAVLAIANNKWISARNYNDNGFVNMFRVNIDNQIEVGAPLLIGSFEFAPDSGYVTLVNMPITSASNLGDEHGYFFNMDSDNILSVRADADGVGGILNKRVCILDDCIGNWDEIEKFWTEVKDGEARYLHPTNINSKVGIGTTTPAALFQVKGIGRFGEIEMDPDSRINMAGGEIIGVSKITVGVVDPLYRINGINYSTFASAIVGGLKEEYIGRVKIEQLNRQGEYEHIFDFGQKKEGSDLWVWRQTVDWSKDNIEVLITPYGRFAKLYYLIEDEKLIFRADRPVEVSYRLIGKRFDWKKWPTKAIDQTETPSFIINTK